MVNVLGRARADLATAEAAHPIVLAAIAEATGVTIEPLPDGEGPWLAGRAARVVVNGTWVGCFGEIDPHVGDAFELAVPMNAAEFDMAALDAALPDPV